MGFVGNIIIGTLLKPLVTSYQSHSFGKSKTCGLPKLKCWGNIYQYFVFRNCKLDILGPVLKSTSMQYISLILFSQWNNLISYLAAQRIIPLSLKSKIILKRVPSGSTFPGGLLFFSCVTYLIWFQENILEFVKVKITLVKVKQARETFQGRLFFT